MDVPNLLVVNLEVMNGGNRDFTSFTFGVTLTEGDFAVHCDVSSADRHHGAEIVLGPGAPAKTLDLKLTPFNRGDAYSFTVGNGCS